MSTHEYPIESGLDDMIEESSALIDEEIGHTSNIGSHLIYLRNLCYRMVELMIDEESGRAEGKNIYIPKDYMYERDRAKLRRYGKELGYRRFGGTTSG